jgi:hypothetical protein
MVYFPPYFFFKKIILKNIQKNKNNILQKINFTTIITMEYPRAEGFKNILLP